MLGFKFKFLNALMSWAVCVVFFAGNTTYAMPPRAGQIVILTAQANGLYVGLNSSRQLIANGTAERFKLVEEDEDGLGDGLGYFALQCMTPDNQNRRLYVSYTQTKPTLLDSSARLGPQLSKVGFQIVDLGNSNIALKAFINGRYGTYVCADNSGASPLIANRAISSPGPWETFNMKVVDPVFQPGELITLRAMASPSTVFDIGVNPDSTMQIFSPSGLPQLEVVDLGGGVIAFRAWQTTCFLHADFDASANMGYQTRGLGKYLVVATGQLLSQWEKFRVVDYDLNRNTYRLVTEINKKYLRIDFIKYFLYADGDANNGTYFVKTNPQTEGYLALQKANDGVFVTSPQGSPLLANRVAANQWEKYHLFDMGSGNYSLVSENGTQMWVGGFSNQNNALIANAKTNTPDDQFQFVNAGNDLFCLKASTTNNYVNITSNKNLYAYSAFANAQKFRLSNVIANGITNANPAMIRPYAGKTMSLKSLNNYLYVHTVNNVNTPLTAGSSTIGTWEKYSIVDGGYGMVAFKAANNMYVSVPNLGNNPLRPSSGTINDSTRFRIVDAGGINVNIIADKNHRFLSLDNSNQLVANVETSTPPGPKETFEMIFSSPLAKTYYGAQTGFESALYGSGPYFDGEGVNGTQRTLPQYSNIPLSQGKTTIVTNGNGNSAVDGNETTYWSPTGANPTLKVNLGAPYTISGFDLIWQTADNYSYRIQVSPDDVEAHYQTIINKTSNEQKQFIEFSYDGSFAKNDFYLQGVVNMQWVRLIIYAPLSPNLAEFKVRGYNDVIKQKYWNNVVEQLTASGVDFVLLNTSGVANTLPPYINFGGDPRDATFVINAIRNRPGCKLKIAVYPFEMRLNEVRNLYWYDNFSTQPPFDFNDVSNITFFWDKDLKLFYDCFTGNDHKDTLLFKVNNQPLINLWSLANPAYFNQFAAYKFCKKIKDLFLADNDYKTWGMAAPYIFAESSWATMADAGIGDTTTYIDALYGWPSSGDPWSYYTLKGTKNGSAMAAIWNDMPQNTWQYFDPDSGRTFARALNQLKGEGCFINLIEGFTDYAEANLLSRIKDGTYEDRQVTYPSQRLNILRRFGNNPSTISPYRYEAEGCDKFYHNGTPGNVYREGNIEIEEIPNPVNGIPGWDVKNMKTNDWLEWEEVPLKGDNVYQRVYFTLAYSATAAQGANVYVDNNLVVGGVLNSTSGNWSTATFGPMPMLTNDQPHTVRIKVATGGNNLKIDYWTWHN